MEGVVGPAVISNMPSQAFPHTPVYHSCPGAFPRVPPSDPSYLPLAEVVKLAELAASEVAPGKPHGFKFLQAPVGG